MDERTKLYTLKGVRIAYFSLIGLLLLSAMLIVFFAIKLDFFEVINSCIILSVLAIPIYQTIHQAYPPEKKRDSLLGGIFCWLLVFVFSWLNHRAGFLPKIQIQPTVQVSNLLGFSYLLFSFMMAVCYTIRYLQACKTKPRGE